MKKLEVKNYRETVTGIKEFWEILHDYNLIYYYVNDTYLYIYSRVTKKEALYLYDNDLEKEIIKERIENIKKDMKKSYVNIRNVYEIKKQSAAMWTNKCNDREIRKGVFRKDTFFKGFFIECFTQNEQREYNEYYNVFLSGYILKSKWAYDFEKYIKLKNLTNVWNRDDLLLMDNNAGEIVDKIEAIKRIKEGGNIEVGYTNNSGIVCFSKYYWVDGDIFDVDDFVYCNDSESLIDTIYAVWCDDVQDYRHIDDTYTDFHGNIFGSDADLIYSEEKNYYIYEGDAVKIYIDERGNYFWVHCDDLEDYFFHEDDEEYYTYQDLGLIRAYQKTNLSPIDSGDKPYFLGIELEMENDETYNKKEREEDIIEILNAEKSREYYDNILDWKEDGSLENGVEMVTAPISLAMFRKEIVPIIKKMQEIGYTSEKGGRCGNHIHISRIAFSEEAQARLVLIYARFENIIKILSRRNGAFSYCKDVLTTVTAVSVDTADEIVKYQKSRGKSTAINFNNSNTIEFRIFRGTMNTDVLVANIQLVQLLADLALTEMSIQDILNLTFNKLIQKMQENGYQELLQYSHKKGLLD